MIGVFPIPRVWAGTSDRTKGEQNYGKTQLLCRQGPTGGPSNEEYAGW